MLSETAARVLALIEEYQESSFSIKASGGTVRWIGWKLEIEPESVASALTELVDAGKMRSVGFYGNDELFSPVRENA